MHLPLKILRCILEMKCLSVLCSSAPQRWSYIYQYVYQSTYLSLLTIAQYKKHRSIEHKRNLVERIQADAKKTQRIADLELELSKSSKYKYADYADLF
jgi:hypothetical protein